MKSYKIIDVQIPHPVHGVLNKKQVVYYVDGVEELRENYIEGDSIRSEYTQSTPDATVLGLVSRMSPDALAQLKELLK